MAVAALYTTSVAKKTTSSTITGVVVSSGDALYVILEHNQKTGAAGKYATNVDWDVGGVGEPLSKVGTGQAQNGKACIEIWKLAAPTAKTATVTITWVDNNANWNGDVSTAVVISGHDTGTPDDGWVTNSGTSTTASLAITTEADDFNIAGATATIQALTESGDGTEQWNDSTNSCEGAGADHTAVDTQSDHAWTLASADWVTAGININVASLAGISGTVNASSSVTGDILGRINISGEINASSSVTGDILGRADISGEINSSSSVTGDILGKYSISGTINTASSVTGDILGRADISGEINSSSSVTGTIGADGKLSGIVNTSSAVSGIMYGASLIRGSIRTSLITDIFSYWKLEEASGDALDEENRNDLSPSGGVTHGSTGKIKDCFAFATNGRIGGVRIIDYEFTGTFSFAVWFKTTYDVVWTGIVSNFGIANYGWELIILDTGELYWRTRNSVGNIVCTSGSGFNDGNWHLAVCTFRISDGRQRLYIDDQLKDTDYQTNGIDYSTSNIFDIGSRGSTAYFNGSIDEVGIWANVELNLEDVVKLFNTDNGISHPFGFVTGILIGKTLIFGDSDGVATVTGTLQADGELVGIVNASSTVTGIMITDALIGSATGSSSVTGTLQADGELIGVINTSSSVTGTMQAVGILAGVINASSTVTGVMIIDALIGTSNGVSTVTGVVQATGALAGVINTSSTITGVIKTEALVGVSNGASTVTGAMQAVGVLSGVVNASSTVTGIMITDALIGVINGASVVTGVILGIGKLISVINTASSVTGDILGKINISGIVNAFANVTGIVRGIGALVGVVNTASDVTGDLVGVAPSALAGTIDASSSVSGTITATGSVAGTVDGVSAVSGSILSRVAISGQVDGSSSVVGVVAGKVQMVGIANGLTDLQAILVGSGTLGGLADCSSTVTGSVVIPVVVVERLIKNSVITTLFTGSSIITMNVVETSKIAD